MTRLWPVLMGVFLAPLFACKQQPEPFTPAEPNACTDTWENHAEGFLRTWCTGCHSSHLEGASRYGAPMGLNFDDYDVVFEQSAAIKHSIYGEEASMPPAGGPTDSDRERLAQWIDCGVSVETPPQPPVPALDCETAVMVQAENFVVCEQGPVAIEGNLVISTSTNASCLCSINGNLTVNAEFSANNLTEISGDLNVRSAPSMSLESLTSIKAMSIIRSPLAQLSLPKLDVVDGELNINRNHDLTVVDLPQLTLAGNITISDNKLLEEISLQRLYRAASLKLIDLPALQRLIGEGYALTETGDLIMQGLPKLEGFYGFGWLTSVSGDLILSELNTAYFINGFTIVEEIDGDLIIINNNGVGELDGFDNLTTVRGDVIISNNALLTTIGAFARLNWVGENNGTLAIESNPLLEDIEAFSVLKGANHITVSDLPAVQQLVAFNKVTHLTGDVQLSNIAATHLLLFESLQSHSGSVVFDSLPQATTITALNDLEQFQSVSLSAAGGVSSLSLLQAAHSGDQLTLSGLGPQVITLPLVQSLQSLVLTENASLQTLDAPNLNSITTLLQVQNNPQLDESSLTSLVNSAAGATILVD